MKPITDKPSCGCGTATTESNSKDKTLDNAFPVKPLASFGVSLMGSMQEASGGCCSPGDTGSPLSAYDKPGYTRGHYVTDFIRTKVGDVPVIAATLSKKDLFSTFYGPHEQRLERVWFIKPSTTGRSHAHDRKLSLAVLAKHVCTNVVRVD